MVHPRLLQVFLSKHGAYEVSVTPVDHDLACTCPGFSSWKKCKHTAYVRARLDEDGAYAVELPDDVHVPAPEEMLDPSAWRQFVLHNAPVVVL